MKKAGLCALAFLAVNVASGAWAASSTSIRCQTGDLMVHVQERTFNPTATSENQTITGDTLQSGSQGSDIVNQSTYTLDVSGNITSYAMNGHAASPQISATPVTVLVRGGHSLCGMTMPIQMMIKSGQPYAGDPPIGEWFLKKPVIAAIGTPEMTRYTMSGGYITVETRELGTAMTHTQDKIIVYYKKINTTTGLIEHWIQVFYKNPGISDPSRIDTSKSIEAIQLSHADAVYYEDITLSYGGEDAAAAGHSATSAGASAGGAATPAPSDNKNSAQSACAYMPLSLVQTKLDPAAYQEPSTSHNECVYAIISKTVGTPQEIARFIMGGMMETGVPLKNIGKAAVLVQVPSGSPANAPARIDWTSETGKIYSVTVSMPGDFSSNSAKVAALANPVIAAAP